MLRWRLVWLRNRVLAILAFTLVAAVVGGVSIMVFAQFRHFEAGAVAGGLAALGVVLWMQRGQGLFSRVAERLITEERELDPRRPAETSLS